MSYGNKSSDVGHGGAAGRSVCLGRPGLGCPKRRRAASLRSSIAADSLSLHYSTLHYGYPCNQIPSKA